tara:strand:+ start:585 stop:1052 length:468 start_codon:yes stop_codon:yes gene_type:complete
MKPFTLIIFFLLFTFSKSFSQGKKIDLNEVEVNVKALPIINISGVNYSFKERDYFITRLLTEPFWSKNFQIKIDLSSFYEDRNYVFIIDGKTIVKVDGEVLFRGHKYRSIRKIKKLLPEIKTVSIKENGSTEVEIKTEISKNILLMKLQKGIVNR